MKEFIKERCDRMVKDKKMIHKATFFEFDIMEVVASLVLSGAGKDVDIERFKNCRKILKRNVAFCSCIRGIGETLTVCKMALAEDPEQYVKDLKTVFDKAMKKRLINGEYMVLAAANVCDNGRAADVDVLVKKFKEIEDRMEKEHPILTGSEDWSLSMLLAMTEKSVDTIINEMEEAYDYMRAMKFNSTRNGLQNLTQVLVLMGGDMKSKCDKVISFVEKLKEKGARYGKDFEVAALGTLIDIDENEDALVTEIIETADYLKACKGFGSWHIDKKTRLMLAAMIVAESYEKNHLTSIFTPRIETGAITSTTAVTIATTIMMMMIVCCCYMASSN